MNKKIFFSVVLIIIIALSVKVKAWIEPEDAGNILAPLNSSSSAQSKLGGLVLNLGNAAYGLIVHSGNSGFGTDNPTERIDVNGNVNVSGNIKLNGKISGLQAPIDSSDAVNKGYVDALSNGGDNYTGWGITTCAAGYSAAYTGLTLMPQTVYGSTICEAGDIDNFRPGDYTDYDPNESTSNDFWYSVGQEDSHGGMVSWSQKAIPCVVCVKN